MLQSICIWYYTISKAFLPNRRKPENYDNLIISQKHKIKMLINLMVHILSHSIPRRMVLRYRNWRVISERIGEESDRTEEVTGKPFRRIFICHVDANLCIFSIISRNRNVRQNRFARNSQRETNEMKNHLITLNHASIKLSLFETFTSAANKYIDLPLLSFSFTHFHLPLR